MPLATRQRTIDVACYIQTLSGRAKGRHADAPLATVIIKTAIREITDGIMSRSFAVLVIRNKMDAAYSESRTWLRLYEVPLGR